MRPSKNRPLGVTLLALIFLWIGCIGTVVLPITLASSGIGNYLALLNPIHRTAVASFVIHVLLFIWFCVYVLYAGIGFGLWGLRDWSRRAVIAISAITLGLTVLICAFFVRPAVLITPILMFAAIALGLQIWYLRQPDVRLAFDSKRLELISTMPAAPPPRPRKRSKVRVAIAVLAAFAVFVVTLILAVQSIMRRSDIYRLSLSSAQADPCVIAKLGQPINDGWNISGNIQETGSNGNAELSIPLHGPKGDATLTSIGKKLNGSWQVTSLILENDQDDINLTPGVIQDCH